MAERFAVTWNEECVTIDDRRTPRKPRTVNFKWTDIERVCFEARDFIQYDLIHVFVTGRDNSYFIPIEAQNGGKFWNEILKRGLFDHDLSVVAFGVNEGLFCWPPPTSDEAEPST
jgi:hypothetical protein